MRRAGVARIALAALLAAVPTAALGPGTGSDVPRMASVEAQLDHARKARTALRGLRGEEREAARGRAVEACRAVREY